jgi:hypothetical protein
VQRLSFKGTVDALRQGRELFENTKAQPRAVKRRPKNFRLLTKPRHEMIVERNRKQSQKPSKNALK